jgi:DNA polymerase III subunit delta
MKANKGQVERALDAGGAPYKLILLYGPDEAGSRALVQRLVRAMGLDAEKIELDGGTLKADPALLADEAASLSLFGGKRFIIVSVSGDEANSAIESLLQSEGSGNPVIVLAGALKPSSALLKRLLADPNVACLASYVPGDAEMAQIAGGLAHEQGLRLDSATARRLVNLSGNDRAVMAREIEKLALYLDASPTAPQAATIEALDAVGADNGEPDLSVLTDSVFGGKPEVVAVQLAGLAAEGVDGIAVLRALNRRVNLLLKIGSEIAQGKSIDSATQAIFFKEKGAVTQQLRRWTPDRLAIAAQRLLDAERAIKSARSVGPILADAELITIARAARR